MSNTHAIPDSYYENQAVWGDLGPAVIVAYSGLTVPASSLTMPAVSAQGYVLAGGPPARLVYVSQPAVNITLSSTAGTYWLALHADLSTPVAGWTRRAGSHWLWQLNATFPGHPPGGLLLASLGVTGGVITTVDPLLFTTATPMSRQSSADVNITGGVGTFTTSLGCSPGATTLASVTVAGVSQLDGQVGCGMAPQAGYHLTADHTYLNGVLVTGDGRPQSVDIRFNKNVQSAMLFHQTTSDGGGGQPMYFYNVGGTPIGSITTTGSGTAFNTSSDARLKTDVTPLPGALAVIQALHPIAFRWKATGDAGVGFLAHELQQVLPDAVTGAPDAVNDDGSIQPQQVDHSKLVPWLVASIQELAAQVQTLTARLATLEDALGA